MAEKTQQGRIALVTGANKGIGLEVARRLAKEGMTVLLGARDATRGAQAAATLRGEGLEVREIALDLGDESTLREAAQEIEGAHHRLDVLVNNAGIVDPKDGPPSAADLGAVRRIFETNVFGTLAVTQAMLPLLRKSLDARIVNVSSGLGSLAQNGDPKWEHYGVKPLGYNASKAALNMMTVGLAYELRDTPIKVNAADPGYTATDLNGNSGPQTVQEGSEAIFRLATLGADGPTGGYFDKDGAVPW